MAPKVTLHRAPTPSEEVIDEANKIVVVTDKLGRQLSIRKPRTSVRRRIAKAISADASSKPAYFGMVMLAACVVEIDGEMVPLPANELQFDALIDRLDDEGLEAVGAGMVKHFKVAVTEDEMEDAKN